MTRLLNRSVFHSAADDEGISYRSTTLLSFALSTLLSALRSLPLFNSTEASKDPESMRVCHQVRHDMDLLLSPLTGVCAACNADGNGSALCVCSGRCDELAMSA